MQMTVIFLCLDLIQLGKIIVYYHRYKYSLACHLIKIKKMNLLTFIFVTLNVEESTFLYNFTRTWKLNFNKEY